MNDRIIDKKVEIDYKNTQDFFESRGKNGKKLENKYNYVLFQDDNPTLALNRDQIEKRKIGSYLFAEDNNSESEVRTALDLGCGIGRWGEELLTHNVHYVGIDYSQNLLTLANENLKSQKGSFQLIHGAVQNLPEILLQERLDHSFDFILINGVLMYLNDADLKKVLETIRQLIGINTIIYLKETVSKEKRLTLNEFYSKELTQNYTAIYRNVNEYTSLIKQIFINDNNMEWIASGELFEDELHNRKETTDYYFLLKSTY